MSIKQMGFTGRQILALADFAGFDIDPRSKVIEHLEAEITVLQDKDGIEVKDEDGELDNISDCIAYFSEYPDEGCIDLQPFG